MSPINTDQIVTFKVEDNCMKTLPCRHDCVIKYTTGEVAKKCLSWNAINEIIKAIPNEKFIGNIDHFKRR